MKLGPHVIRPTAGALEWARHAPVVKAVDDPTPLQVAQPDALRIYRAYFPEQPMDADPRAVVDRILSGLKDYRHTRLMVEVYNEVGRAETVRYIALLQRVVPLLHAGGVDVCGPSWSTGGWEREDWEAFRRAGWCGLNAVAVHCYWGREGLTPWHALRYRQWSCRGDPRVVITECGRDAVEGGQAGWRKCGISGAEYLSELRAFDAELSRDAYVLGATVYSAGPTADWVAFSTDELDTRAFHGPPVVSAPVDPPDTPPVNGGGKVTEAEFGRWCADVFHRANIPYNSESALVKFWRDQARAGHYLGKPEGLEHPTENGRYIIQEYSSAVLCYDRQTGAVSTKIPFV